MSTIGGVLFLAGLIGRGLFHEDWAKWRVLSGRKKGKLVFDFATWALIVFLRNNIILSTAPKVVDQFILTKCMTEYSTLLKYKI